jgi:hypothetical protein
MSTPTLIREPKDLIGKRIGTLNTILPGVDCGIPSGTTQYPSTA